MRKKKVILPVIFIVFVVGVAVIIRLGIPPFEEEKQQEKDLGIPISVEEVEKDDIAEKLSYSGTVKGKEETIISPEITSELKILYVEEGEYINESENIARLSGEKLRANLETIQKQISAKEKEYTFIKNEIDRYEEKPIIKRYEEVKLNYEHLKDNYKDQVALYEAGVISEKEYENHKHELKSAEKKKEELEASVDDGYIELKHKKDMTEKTIDELRSRYREAELKLDDTTIRAPNSGKVKDVKYSPGELAAAGKPFAVIEDVNEVVISVSVTQADLKSLKEGMEAEISFVPVDIEKKGSIIDISGNINPKTRTAEVEVGRLKLDGAYKNSSHENIREFLGASADVEFITDRQEKVVTVERKNIKEIGDREVVYVFEDGQVFEREVKTGLTAGNRIHIMEGLSKGEKIATENLNRLYEGAEVYNFEGAIDQ